MACQDGPVVAPTAAPRPLSCLCRVCLVLEEFVRLLHHCGMSLTELDICNGRGATVNEIMAQGRAGQWTVVWE